MPIFLPQIEMQQNYTTLTKKQQRAFLAFTR